MLFFFFLNHDISNMQLLNCDLLCETVYLSVYQDSSMTVFFFFADAHGSRLPLVSKKHSLCVSGCVRVRVCVWKCLSVHSNEGVISLPRVLRALPPSDPYLSHSPPPSHSNLCSSFLPVSAFADYTDAHINTSIYTNPRLLVIFFVCLFVSPEYNPENFTLKCFCQS